MYERVWKAGTFRACDNFAIDAFELADLQAGHLPFWTDFTKDGKTDRNPPVIHVAIYLGVRTATGHPLCGETGKGAPISWRSFLKQGRPRSLCQTHPSGDNRGLGGGR